MNFLKLLLLLPLIVPDSYADFINNYPAKKEKTISYKFGVALLDNYAWMDGYSDPDFFIWRDHQNIQAKSYIGSQNITHYENVTNEVNAFIRESSLKIESQQLEDNLDDESGLYQVSMEDVQETGGRYGSLQRIILKDRVSGEIKEIRLGYYFQILKWIDSETYVYANFQTKRMRLNYSHVVAIHTVGEHFSDDEVLITSKPGDFFEFHRSRGRIFLNHFDGLERDINVSLLDPLTGKLSGTVHFGKKMQYIGEANEGREYFHYVAEYKNKNYSEVVKVSIDTGERTILFSPKDFVPRTLRYITENKYLLLAYKDGESLVGVLDNGNFKQIPMPKGGQIRVKEMNSSAVELSWQSYSNTRYTFKYDFLSGQLIKTNEYSYRTEIETRKIHYTAPNGQKAFIWLSKKPETKLSASTPLILYGYGGWYHSELPTFNRAESVGWIEKGGVFAVAAIPGSLAYGMEWNQIAKAHNRVTSFDSMANAAKELIKRGFTSSQNIGVFGASNGGLLVAGTIMKYPNLFKAAVPAVGVYNLINCSDKGMEWELGTPCIEDEFHKLLKVSPIHNVKEVDYPSVLIMTADQDSVTNPIESYKLGALMQEKSTSNNPILIYTKIGGGHSISSGSPAERLGYVSYLYSFFEKELGL